MRTHTQNIPTGGDSATDFSRQQQSRSNNELQLYDSDDIVFEQTTRGIRAYLKKQIYASQASGPSPFLLVSDGGDWYNCQSTTDGVTGTGPIIKIAKHQDLRCILSTATPAGGAWPGNPSTRIIRGITYTYIYNQVGGMTTDGVNIIEYTRSVTGSDSTTSLQKITPCLNVGDIVMADPCTFSAPATLKDVTWIARADGRAWAGPNPAM